MKKSERGLFEIYQNDPERADALVFGRRADKPGPEASRRGFLKGAGLAAMGAALGATIPFAHQMPGGLVPAAFASDHDEFIIEGKDGLRLLNDRPVNAETPAYLLDDAITPNSRHFVRNNGLVPDAAAAGDASGWSLEIDGEVDNPLTLSLADLKNNFSHHTLALQIECGGNGRASFEPPAKGNQWSTGAVGCSRWTGVRMADVLRAAGIRESAIYTGYYGNDVHLSGDAAKDVISRGAPIWKMMEPHTLLAWDMNGAALPQWHGFPVRIVAPGWPGSVSGKWVRRIWLRDQVHDGKKMTGKAYRTPDYPVAPGEKIPDEDWRIIQSMPVKSLITYPKSGTSLGADNRLLEVRGHAWAGDDLVSRVEVTYDFGATWQLAELDAPVNRYAWQNWRARIRFPTKGYYEVWARATDDQGRMQPFAIDWNAKGYLNNSMHRVAVRVPS
jgi:DMSO/TMAO reductase YedYZ molybdopterin-dependent catalytic subunit